MACAGEGQQVARGTIVHQVLMVSRRGVSDPEREACAVTANISPDSSARKLPLADRISRRLAQPRVMTLAPVLGDIQDCAFNTFSFGKLTLPR